MLLGKPRPPTPRKPIDRVPIPLAQHASHVSASVIGRLDGEDSLIVLEGEQILARRLVAAGESLIREDFELGWMIHGDELDAIEIDDLVHRLGNLEDILAVEWFELVARDPDRLLRPRRPMSTARQRLSHRPSPQNIR